MSYRSYFSSVFRTVGLLMLFGLMALGANAQAISFQQMDQDNGLPDGQINDLHSDKRGFLWAATSAGLARYNGDAWTIFRSRPEFQGSLADNNVNCIAMDSDGGLWLGSEYEGLVSFDWNSELFSSYFPELPDGEIVRSVIALTSLGNAEILVGTPQGLFSFSPNSKLFSLIPFPDDGSREVRAMHRHRDEIYVATASGLYVYSPKIGTLHKRDLGDLTSPINTILSLELEDSLWIGTVAGLFCLPIDTVNSPPQRIRPLQNVSISSLSGFYSDWLWVGTFEEGLFQYNTQTGGIRNFRHDSENPTSLSENTISSLLMLPEGIVLAGTANEGLSVLDQNQTNFSFFPTGDNDEISSGVNAIVSDFKYPILWFGADDGLFRQEMGGEILEFNDLSQATGLPSVPVYALLPGGANPLLVGTGGGGLLCSSEPHGPMQDLQFEKVAGLQSDEILALDYSADGRVWVGIPGFSRHAQIRFPLTGF